MCENDREVVEKSVVADETTLTRRDVLKKYGAYSAPAVVALLLPQNTMAGFGMTTFSSVMACNMAHGGGMRMHCIRMHT